MTGNAVRTFVRFGYLEHPAVKDSIDWIVRTERAVDGWPCFPSRQGTPDGWEGVPAFADIPESERDAAVRRSVENGSEFFRKRRLIDEGSVRYPPWFGSHYPNHATRTFWPGSAS